MVCLHYVACSLLYILEPIVWASMKCSTITFSFSPSHARHPQKMIPMAWFHLVAREWTHPTWQVPVVLRPRYVWGPVVWWSGSRLAKWQPPNANPLMEEVVSVSNTIPGPDITHLSATNYRQIMSLFGSIRIRPLLQTSILNNGILISRPGTFQSVTPDPQ